KFNVSSSLPIEWIYLYHNTCYTDVPSQDGFLFKQYSQWTNVVSRNNIFAGTAYAFESWDVPNPVDFDYDDLYTTRAATRLAWGGIRYDSLTGFSSGTGQETHGVSVLPGFVDPMARDFYLRSDSGLLDRATLLPGVNDGYLNGGPDIGALEYGMKAVAV